MLNLGTATPEQVASVKSAAVAHFAPFLLREALLRLCEIRGRAGLDAFEKDVTKQIEAMRDRSPDFEIMKDLAFEQLFLILRELKGCTDMKQPLERIVERRTQGRSEVAETLEDQLQEGLEDTFPASDPPAVTSTTIAGRSKEIAGPARSNSSARRSVEKG